MDVHHRTAAAVVDTALQTVVEAITVAIGGGNLNGDGRRAGVKSKPLIVVQHKITPATREALLLVVVVDGVAITIQVFAQNRGLWTSIARLRKTRRRTLRKSKLDSTNQGKERNRKVSHAGGCRNPVKNS